MPNDNCPLCVAIGLKLQAALDLLEPEWSVQTGDSIEEVRAHLLAAICSWWMMQCLQDPTFGPEAIVRCVANCLAQDGIQGAERLTAVRLSRTT